MMFPLQPKFRAVKGERRINVGEDNVVVALHRIVRVDARRAGRVPRPRLQLNGQRALMSAQQRFLEYDLFEFVEFCPVCSKAGTRRPETRYFVEYNSELFSVLARNNLFLFEFTPPCTYVPCISFTILLFLSILCFPLDLCFVMLQQTCSCHVCLVCFQNTLYFFLHVVLSR